MSWDKQLERFMKVAFAAGLIAMGLMLTVSANAADKGGSGSIAGPLTYLGGSGSFSGLGVGVSGSALTGQLDFGGPFDFSANGQLLSGVVSYDLQAGQIVIGLAAEYGKHFGDLGKLVDTEWTIRGRGGFVIAPNTLLFGHVGYAQAETDFGTLNGWKLGPGVSIRVPDSQLFVDFRYDYGIWDVDHLTTADATTHALAVVLTYKLGK